MVVFDDLTYATVKASERFVARQTGYWNDTFDHALGQLKRGVQKCFLAGSLKNGIILNMQVTELAMRAAVAEEKVTQQQQVLVAIILTAFTSTFRIAESFQIMKMSTEWY